MSFFKYLLFCGLLFAHLGSSLQAQETPQTLLTKGMEAINNGNFEESARVLQDLLTKFPSDNNAPNARYLLGISQYSLGNYAEAIKNLTDSKDFIKDTQPIAAFHLGASHFFLGHADEAIAALEISAKSDNKEIIPYSLLYLARAYMDRGTKLLPTDKAKANASFDAGLTQINELITKYPQDENLIDAYMTRASLNAISGKYDAAASTIEELKGKPGGAEMSEDADYLLGFIYSQQTQGFLADYKSEEAAQSIQKARETYQRLQKSDNLLVANDASYQLANLSFADKKYEQALSEFRALRSKDEIVESQKKRIADLRKKVSESASNKSLLTNFQRNLQREEAKLKSVKENADTSLDALIRVGDCYRQLRKYDEARTVYRQAAKFAEGDKIKDLSLQIIVSQALQGLGSKADAGFDEFKKKYPNDPMAEGVPYFIASALIKQDRLDEAVLKLQDIIKTTPDSKYAVLAMQELARALLAQKKAEEALKVIQDFSTKVKSGSKLPPEVLEDAEFFRGATLFQLDKKDEAVAVMKALAASSKNDAIKQSATYEVAKMLKGMGKAEETIKAMQDFIAAYPNSPNADKALVTIADTYDKLGKTDEALKSYRDIISKSSDTNVKIYALENTWRIHLKAGRYDDMVKVQDELIAAFPDSSRGLVALSERAKYLQEKAKKPEEAAAIQQQLMDKYEKLSVQERKDPYGRALGAYVVRILQKRADTDFKTATKMGAPAGMDEAKKAEWKKLLDSSNKSLDKAITEFPGTDILGNLLKNKTDVMLVMIGNKLMDQEAAFTYLSQLAGNIQDEALKAQVLITRASLAYQLGQKRVSTNLYKDALAQITNPQSVAWQEYERYGSILLEDKQWEEAIIQFQKLRENFPKPDKAQEAAIYGLGAANLGKKDNAKAQQLFTELKEKYPKSDKLLEAEFSQALLTLEAGKYDEGFEVLKKVMNSPAASNLTRARSLLEFGKNLEIIGDKKLKTKETVQGEGKPDLNIYELAEGYYLKVTLLYTSQTDACAEALYRLVGIKNKQGKKDEARKFGTELSTKYPASEWAEKVQALLK